MTINFFHGKQLFLVCLVALATIPFVLSFPAWRAGFIADDYDFLMVNAPRVGDGLQAADLRAIFTTNIHGTQLGSSYRPLTVLSLASEQYLYGSNPRGFHLISIILHGLNVILIGLFIFGLLRYKQRSYAFAVSVTTAALFALFHFHAEAVLWIGARADVLCTFFALCALNVFVWLFSSKSVAASIIVSAFVAAALLAKEAALVLPMAFFLLLFIVPRERRMKRAFSFLILPQIFITAAFFIARAFTTGSAFATYLQVTPWQGSDTLVAYGKFLVNATALHLLPGLSRSELALQATAFPYLAALAVIIIAALLIFGAYERRAQVIAVGVFLLSLIPAASFGINTFRGLYDDGGERFLYLPSIFSAWLIATFVVAASERFVAYRRFIFFVLAIYLIGQASVIWSKAVSVRRAGDIASTIIADVGKYVAYNPDGLVLIALPDNLNGAHILAPQFFLLALQYHYDFYLADTIVFPVHLVLSRDLLERQPVLLGRAAYPGDIFFEAPRGLYPIRASAFSGMDYTLELDDRFSNRYRKMHVRFTPEFLAKNRSKNVIFLYFDGEHLQRIDIPKRVSI